MAQVFSAPAAVGNAPEFNFSEESYASYQKRCDAFTQSVVKWAREHGEGSLRGEEVQFPVADGYARYIVLSTNPVKLIHLPLGDAWHFEYASRLLAKDIQELVRRRKAFNSLFSAKKVGQRGAAKLR
jgi:hypothetical protein